MKGIELPSANKPRSPRLADRIATKVPDAVREIVALHGAGLSIRAIVQALNDANIPSATGGKWHIRTVQLALRQAQQLNQGTT